VTVPFLFFFFRDRLAGCYALFSLALFSPSRLNWLPAAFSSLVFSYRFRKDSCFSLTLFFSPQDLSCAPNPRAVFFRVPSGRDFVSLTRASGAFVPALISCFGSTRRPFLLGDWWLPLHGPLSSYFFLLLLSDWITRAVCG